MAAWAQVGVHADSCSRWVGDEVNFSHAVVDYAAQVEANARLERCDLGDHQCVIAVLL